MIDEALEGLRDVAKRNGCAYIMDNIDITMDVMRRSSDEDEKSIAALAFSFFADYAIDRRNIKLLQEIYSLAGKLNLLDEFHSRKAYEIIYSLRNEMMNVHPKGLGELISFMEGLEAEELDYRIMPYDPGNVLVVE
ncbi:MAG TPA: hypothetical protein VD757_01920 [Candidatus Nitrosocosmicus sp.]|nr:hypothetical protein [Candidatus Nitrosocosmicus sp.]